jgi:SAM-dependent methyltransferase
MPLDEIAVFNRERWEELAAAGVRYSRPILDLDPVKARQLVDPERALGPVDDLDVLCLAGGGGQQSAAFGLLGCRVTVLDLSPTQLARDRTTAAHYGLEVTTCEGDMRDLSRFPDASFDVVWHAHALNFVPEGARVLQEVGRVLRPGGRYRLYFSNPYVQGAWAHPVGAGFLLTQPHADSAPIAVPSNEWEITSPDGSLRRIEGPREFRHTLSTVVNTLARSGLVIVGLWETCWEEPVIPEDPEPGTWDHFRRVAPPFLTVQARKLPLSPS